MSSTPLRVAVRIRPSQPHDGAAATSVRSPAPGRVAVQQDGGAREFAFDTVFGPEASQHEVYTKCAAPLVDALLDARNACIFAFGSTGAGKTFSMLGPEGGRQGSSNEGILPRVAAELFRRLEQLKAGAENIANAMDYQVRASFLEVYRESAFDLLSGPVSRDRDAAQAATIRQDKDGRVYADGAAEESVKSVAQLLKLVARGAAARATAATGVHAHSSRSHAMLVLAVERRWRDPRDPDPSRVRSQVARFTLVDLAGAEGMERAHGGAVDAAGVGTNLGLLVLGRVIQALANGERVPYRDSTLTRLMQSGLGGNAVTQLLACVAPTALDTEISLQTLAYASSAKDVRSTVTAATVTDEFDDDPMIGDVDDEDGQLQRRAIWIETGYGDVFARCVGDPEDPLLLYVHGSGPRNSSMCWNDLVLDVERLAQARGGGRLPQHFYHVAIDCPGYGRSPGSRQTIRSYPGSFISSVIRALGRKSAVSLIGSSQGACAVFNCALECPDVLHSLAVCHPVGHAPQRYDKIAQPALLIFDVEDAGHPVEVGRQMRRYLQDPRYFEFARSQDGDWECLHMGEEIINMLTGSWGNIGKKRGGGKRDPRLPELTRVAGGFKAWNEPSNNEWLPWGNVGSEVNEEGTELVDESNAWRMELDPQSNTMVYRHVTTGRCTKVRPRGQRIIVDKLTGAGAAEGDAAAAGLAAGMARLGLGGKAPPTLFDDSVSEDSDAEEQRLEAEERAAQEQAEREFAQDNCDLCRGALVEPLRLARCRCALCACCIERTIRHTRQCPACGEVVEMDGKVPAQASSSEQWLERLRGRLPSPDLDVQQEYLLQLQLARTRVTRIVLEYGNTASPGGGKTSYTTFVRAVTASGAVSGTAGLIEKVDFNINPGYSKPTATASSSTSKLGFTFDYAMARPYPCYMTLHFQAKLGLPKLQVQHQVQDAAKTARRIIVQTPSSEKGGWRPADVVVFEAELPRNGWVRCGQRQADVEYLPDPRSENVFEHFKERGPVFAHVPTVGDGLGAASATARRPASRGAAARDRSSSRNSRRSGTSSGRSSRNGN